MRARPGRGSGARASLPAAGAFHSSPRTRPASIRPVARVVTIGVYVHGAELPARPARRAGRPAARRPPATWRSRQGVRLGELQAPAGRPRGGRDRIRAPQGTGADDRAAPAPIRRGRPARGRQALPRRARRGVPAPLRRGDPRSGRPGTDRRGDAGRFCDRVVVRRARDSGVPPVADCEPPRGRAPRLGLASASLSRPAHRRTEYRRTAGPNS